MPEPSPSTDVSRGRSLPVLRALIDSVDHEILQLLSRRNGLVAEIADYKRHHRVGIRDYAREREVIDDRRTRGGSLGLSPEVVESMWRLVLWASRDRQAALKAEVPLEVEPRTVAVIGGKGAMGGALAAMFADLGHAVMIADLDTQLTPEEAASAADVVVISVPIDETVRVIEQLGPRVREDALLMDITSIKCAPVQAMLEHSKASVVGTHPLFGPSVHSMQGQRMVICPGRGDEWRAWLESMLKARGLVIMESTPEAHDEAMAIVQVLTHFSTEVMGRAMAKLDVPIEQTLRYTSPVYLMELIMTGRHFAQSPDLYASIQMSNPRTAEVTRAFVEAASELRGIVGEQDHEQVRSMFEQVREYFGDFTHQAMEQSSFLIDRLVERT